MVIDSSHMQGFSCRIWYPKSKLTGNFKVNRSGKVNRSNLNHATRQESILFAGWNMQSFTPEVQNHSRNNYKITRNL